MKTIAVIFTILAVTTAFPKIANFLQKEESNTCQTDLEDAYTKASQMLAEFKSGKLEFITVLNQFTTLVNDMDSMWTKDCSMEQFYDALVDEYTQVVEASNPVYCKNELTKAFPMLVKAVADVKSKNWNQLTLDAIQLATVGEQAFKDCAPTNTTGFFVGDDSDACFNDTEDIFKQCFNVYQMFSSGDINPLALVTMLEKIVTDGQHMVSECGNLQDIVDAGIDEYVKLFNPANATACRDNLNAEWIQGGLIFQDVESSDYTKLLVDAEQFVGLAEQIYVNCPPNITLVGDACEDSAKDMMDQVFDVVQMLVNGTVDPTKILEDAEKAYADLQQLSNCSNVQDFVDAAVEEYVSRVNVTNAAKCGTDVDAVWADVLAVVNDLKNGDDSKLPLDAIKLFTDGETAYGDCKPASFEFGSAPNADACSADAEQAFGTIVSMVQMIQSGKVDPQTIVNDVLSVVKNINDMTTECTSIESLFTVIEDEYVQLVNVANKAGCQSELNQMVPLVEKIVGDLQQGKVLNLAVDVTQAVTIFSEVVKDCRPVSFADTDACEQDAADMMENVVQAIEMVVNGTVDPVKLVMVVSQVYQDFTRMQGECEGTQAFEDVFEAAVETYVANVHVNNPTACTQAAFATYPAVQKCYNDIVNQDYNALTLDAIALVAQATQVKDNCMPVNSTFISGLADGDCTTDVEIVIDNSFTIFQEVNAGHVDVDTLVQQVTDAVNAGFRLPGECTDPSVIFTVFEDEFLKRFNPVNPAACKTDLDTIDASVDKIITDLQNGNTISLVADLLSLYNGAQHVVTDCALSSVRMVNM